jgi:uncharacterized membrane protein SpoIIM required for sporulation
MVLEYILSPLKAKKQPVHMIGIGALYVVLAFFVGTWLFPEDVDMVTVFLCTFASVPLIYDALRLEEKNVIEDPDRQSTMIQHSKAINFFICLFIGFMLAYAILYATVPKERIDPASPSFAFNAQIKTITAINGNATAPTGNAIASASRQWRIFMEIFVNNFKVMLFCLLFSFVYGMGAIFILVWNASVVGTAMGSFIRGNLEHYTAVLGMSGPAAYFKAYSLGLLRYSIHGIPEMAAYFVGGLAGSIISIAIIRNDLWTKNFEKIIMDSSDLILISLGILVVAALLEVFVTPLFFM